MMLDDATQSCAYLYDGTPEGLLCAVFETYVRHEIPDDIATPHTFQPRLDQFIHTVETNMAHAERVRRGIIKKAGFDTFLHILRVSLSDDPAAPLAVCKFIRHTMHNESSTYHAINDLMHPDVAELFRIHRLVMNERHHYLEFLRFEELEGSVWFAQCSPRAKIVPLVMDWFVERFNVQPFIIFDDIHHQAGIYDGDPSWRLVQSDTITIPDRTAQEEDIQYAWKLFYDTLANETRYNPELRRQLLPQRFWNHMPEFTEHIPNKLRKSSSSSI